MPADASIYGLQEPVKLNTPFESLRNILQIRNEQDAAAGQREYRQAIAEQRQAQTAKIEQENATRTATGEALKQGGGVRDQTLSWALQKGDPNTYASLVEFFDKADEKAGQIKKLRKQAKDDEADFLGDLAEGVIKNGSTSEALKTGLAYAVEQFPDYAESAQKIAAQLEGAEPEQVKGFLQQIITLSPARRQKPVQAPATVSPGEGVLNPETGKYDVPLPKPPEKVTYGAPQTLMVNGRRSAVRAGSDGRMYNMNLKPIDGDAIAPEDRPASASAGPRPITQTAEATLVDKLSRQWVAANKTSAEMERQFQIMRAGLQRFDADPNGASQAVLVTFQKMLDPESVVRESEYARSSAGISAMQRIQGYMQRLSAGGAGVPKAQLEEMIKTAQQFKENTKDAPAGARKRIGAVADRYAIPHELIFSGGVPDTVEEWVRDASGKLVKKGGR